MSTDGKWCYIVFWVLGKPDTRWHLLTTRLLEVCPSYYSTSGIYYYRPENQQPKPLDVFLLKFWCSYEREGLLHALLHQEGAREVYACCTHAVFRNVVLLLESPILFF